MNCTDYTWIIDCTYTVVCTDYIYTIECAHYTCTIENMPNNRDIPNSPGYIRCALFNKPKLLHVVHMSFFYILHWVSVLAKFFLGWYLFVWWLWCEAVYLVPTAVFHLLLVTHWKQSIAALGSWTAACFWCFICLTCTLPRTKAAAKQV